MKVFWNRIALAFCLLATATLVSGQTEGEYPLVVQAELPIYHPVARIARVTGVVRVRVTVADGKISGAEGVSGPALLLKPTIENIRTWRFERHVNATFVTTFVYRLDGVETPRMQNAKIEAELPMQVTITASPTKAPCNDCGPDVTTNSP